MAVTFTSHVNADGTIFLSKTQSENKQSDHTS